MAFSRSPTDRKNGVGRGVYPSETALRRSTSRSRPPSQPALGRHAQRPARRLCGLWHPTRERDASWMPNRRPRTSCVHPPFRNPPLARSRRDVRRSLYWRSKTRTPHGASTAAARGGTGPPQVFETQGVLGRSRQVGSVPEVTAIERTPRGSKHFASLRSASCSKPRATGQEPLKR